MIDYFELYKTCLAVLSEKKPNQTEDFINSMSNESYIKSALSDGVDPRALVLASYEVLDNLIESDLIKATKQPLKTGADPIYKFNGLTTTGYQYLKDIDKPTFVERVKKSIKEDGVPVSLEMLSKFISKITF